MLFTRKFLEALRGGAPKDLLATRKMQGSTSVRRRTQELVPDRWRSDPNYPHKLKTLKDTEKGVFLLTAQEVQSIKELFKIKDLEKRGSRNLGNTGITMYIADNRYYIKK